MKKIELTRGLFTKVDAWAYGNLNRYKWYVNYNRHGKYYKPRWKGNKLIQLHREILGLTDRNIQCGHINGDSLDNLRDSGRQLPLCVGALDVGHLARKRGGMSISGPYLPGCDAICFACGREIPANQPRIQWDGWQGIKVAWQAKPHVITIHLHPECADWMSAGMKRDVLELDCGKEAAEQWYRGKDGQPGAQRMWGKEAQK
jgi:hypothetical protein